MEDPSVHHPAVRRARREFLKFLAASPYVASLGGVAAYLQSTGLLAQAQQQARESRNNSDVIASPAEPSTSSISNLLRNAKCSLAIGLI